MIKVSPVTQAWLLLLLAFVAATCLATVAIMTAPGASV
jgi:hypothetical protein